MRSTLSILGLYNYDTDVFKNFVAPTGVDVATAIQTIIFDNAELEIMYPEPDTMQFLIGLWSNKELPVWERVYAACNAQYNPIQNYNRTENWNQTDTGSSSTTTGATETGRVAGYNDDTFTNANQTEDHATGTGSSSLQVYHSGNVSGNIGVTTSQEMLEQELELAPKLDIYQYISDSFKRRFCLMVY